MTDYSIIESHNLEKITNPFEAKLYPRCLAREAGFKRGCYNGFEEARNTFEPKIEEAKRQSHELGHALGYEEGETFGRRQEREGIYKWLSINWTEVNNQSAVYRRADIEKYIGQALKGGE